MKETLAPGVATTRRWIAEKDKTIGFMGDDLRVYATPSIVSDMEYTCRDLLLEHLDDGEDSVGARVEIDHMAPTLMDMWCDITVEVAKIDGRLVTFEFSVSDAVEHVAKGKHVRFVVDKAKTAERLVAKQAKAEGN